MAEPGPSVVAVGGGHGLSASLRAVRRYAASVTAVVSVADDGGSSGRLRAQLPDLPAPGDIRRCLGALATDDGAAARILEYRLDEGEMEGHALGNLLLVALAHELGSFSAAIDEVGRRVGAVGQVVAATSEPVVLEGHGGAEADRPDGPCAIGQVAVQNVRGLDRVALRPADADSDPRVRASIMACDHVVLGPGSVFTSVLAAAIAPQVREALQATSARRVYVANLAPQIPETEGFTVADEVAALRRHGVPVDVVVVDPGRGGGALGLDVEVVEAPVADAAGVAHDPERLGAVLATAATVGMGSAGSGRFADT